MQIECNAVLGRYVDGCRLAGIDGTSVYLTAFGKRNTRLCCCLASVDHVKSPVLGEYPA